MCEDEINNDGNDFDILMNFLIYFGKFCYGEFCLVCIISSLSYDQLVYFDFEIYLMDNCFEYEMVFYIWGGEEDDNIKKYFVFVGLYGDVSFQICNCWEMLWFFCFG